MNEEWKDIKGYEGFYQVSNYGEVRSLDRIIVRGHGHERDEKHFYKGKMLKCGTDRGGYKFVILQKNKVKKCVRVHRLVADAFLDSDEMRTEINHIDGNKNNNTVTNLEYCTPSENIKHAFRIGLRKTHSVVMLDANLFTEVRQFDSISDAQRYFGKDGGTNIENCLNGRSRTAYGYAWRYTDD